MSIRSRVAILAGSAVAVGGLVLAPAVFTAAPASAHTHVWIFACSSASGNGTTYTYTSTTITINGVTTTYSPAAPCP
jgi:hypothetical protein